MLKKVFAGITALTLSVLLAVSAGAASVSDIMTQLESYGASATQVAQVRDYFKSNAGSFTGSELATISDGIDKAGSIMKKYGVTDPFRLPADAKSQIKAIAASTAADVGVTLEFGKSASGATTMTVNKGGKSYTFSSSDSAPKVTGSGSPVSPLAAGLFGGGIIAVVACAAIFMASKNRKMTVTA